MKINHSGIDVTNQVPTNINCLKYQPNGQPSCVFFSVNKYLNVWLFDYLIIWLLDYLIIWLFDYLIIWLFDYLIIWLTYVVPRYKMKLNAITKAILIANITASPINPSKIESTRVMIASIAPIMESKAITLQPVLKVLQKQNFSSRNFSNKPLWAIIN